MTIQDAVLAIAQFVRDTGKPVAESVREMWPKLGDFSDSDSILLLQEGIAQRVNPLLNNPIRYAAAAKSPERGVSVSVTPYQRPSIERHEVTCQVLQDAVYHVNGVAKPIAIFTRYDVLTKLESVRRVEEGVGRHRKMWEYVHGRLTELNKDRVEDLAEGEQIKIARMIYDLKCQKEPELIQ